MRCIVLLAPPPVAEGHVSQFAAGLSPVDTRAATNRGLTAKITQPARRWPMLLGALFALLAAVLTAESALADNKFWSGAGSDDFWTTAANWQGGVAPVPLDTLSFPAVASRLTNTNNFAPNTTFHAIGIGGGGYTLNGNAVTIEAGSTILASLPNGATSTINLDVSGNGTTLNVVQTGSVLVVGGGVSNAGDISKTGTGTAVLRVPGSVATHWFINAGILNVQNGAALGSTSFVQALPGATLQVQGGITVPNSIVLGDTGAPNATGTLESVSGNNTLTGGVLPTIDSTISADAGSTLTMSGTDVLI